MVDTVADAELMLDDLGLPGGARALADACLVRLTPSCIHTCFNLLCIAID